MFKWSASPRYKENRPIYQVYMVNIAGGPFIFYDMWWESRKRANKFQKKKSNKQVKFLAVQVQ